MMYHFTDEEKSNLWNKFENGEILSELGPKFKCSGGTIRNSLIKDDPEKYKKIIKEHVIERHRKVGKLPQSEKQLEQMRKTWQKVGAKIAWKLPRSEKQLEHIKELHNGHSSKAEILFSLILANENISFSHQFRIKKWNVDLFIFPNIIVQIDGVYWHCRYEKGRLLSDWLQNRELKKLGYKVIRFWDFEINNDIDKCVKTIKRFIY